jgi:hypothetical protein
MRLVRELTTLAGVVAASAAVAQGGVMPVDPVAFQALFAAVADDKERAADLVPVWFGPVAEDRTGLYAGMIIRLLRDPEFARYVIGAQDWTVPPGEDPDTFYIGHAAYLAGQTAVDAGMARLPIADQANYLANGTGVAAWVADNHPDSCRRLMTTDEPGDPAIMALQAEYQNGLSPEALFDYLDLGFRAILAEVHQTPAAEDFTTVELERGYDAYQQALEAAVLARPNAEALAAAANLDPAAADGDLCEVMLLTLTIVDELQPPERDWAIRFIITQQ